jgi:hypothetical protein
MISFAKELLCEVVQEVQPLLERHYEELTRNKDVVKLDPAWDEYAALERAGRFVIFTARDDGRLLAYNAFFLGPHLHYKSLVVGQNDVLWIEHEYRKGITPIRFLKYSHTELKSHGAQKIVYHCKDNNLAPILRLLGFSDEEMMVGKMI